MAKIFPTDDKLNWSFFCPGCQTHHGISTTTPGPCWDWNGSVDKPTFNPSLLVRFGRGKVCHSFIRDGFIEYLGDCTHELAGQTVEIPEVER